MRIRERCFVIPLSSYVGDSKNLVEYIRKLFDISHREPIYIVTEPSIITMKMKTKKMWISIEPGSAIICSKNLAEIFEKPIEIAEDTWIESEILIPYTRETLCGLAKTLNIPIDVDRNIGVNHICISSNFISMEILKMVMDGGMIEIIDTLYSDRKMLEVKPRKNKLFIILKGIGIDHPIQLESSLYSYIEIPKEMKIFTEDLIHIDDKPIVMGLGNGYVSLFTSIEPYTTHIYTALLFSAYTTPHSSPRARIFISKISSVRNSIDN